jgi:hypothetical protein
MTLHVHGESVGKRPALESPHEFRGFASSGAIFEISIAWEVSPGAGNLPLGSQRFAKADNQILGVCVFELRKGLQQANGFRIHDKLAHISAPGLVF